MADQIQFRGGPSSTSASFTGAVREITVDTTLNTLRVHDGQTAGGHLLAKVSDLSTTQSDLSTIQTAQTNALAVLGVSSGATSLGTFSGAALGDSLTVKGALQAIETLIETKQSLLGTEQGDLGAFSGNTIADSSSIKTALQALETATELRVTSDAPSFTGVSAFAGDVNFNSGGMFFKQSNNRLGIGTTTPGGGLHIAHSSVNAVFQRDGGSSKLLVKPNTSDDGMTLQGQTNGPNCIRFEGYGNNIGFRFEENNNGSYTTLAHIKSGSIDLKKDTAVTGDLDVSGNVQIDNDGGYYLHFDRNTSTQLDIATGNIPSGGNLNIKNSNGTDAKVVVYSDLFWVRGLGGNSGNGNVKFDGTLDFDDVTLTGIQTSGESFSDDDVSLMTSAAIADYVAANGGSLSGQGVTATVAEINILDGATVTTAELNILDGVTSTATELNLLDGVTATTAEINYLDGVTSNIQTQFAAKANLVAPIFQQGIQFTAGASDISMVDNTADALEIVEGSNQYIAITTTDSGEKIEVFKNLHLAGERLFFDTGSQLIRLHDNQTSALKIENHDGSSQDFLDFKTANTGCELIFGAPNQFNNTITVGADDTGHDVIFYGATASAYMQWDESADALVLAGSATLDVAGDIDVDGTSNLDVLDVDGTANFASTVEVNNTLTMKGNISFTGSGREIRFKDNTYNALRFQKEDGTTYMGFDSQGDATIFFSQPLDVNTTMQIDGTVTVGVDDTGYDVKFFGAASGAYMLWDESDNILELGGGSGLALDAGTLVYGGVAVTSTAAELNILDGVTSTAAELNILDGVTATAAELNILDGVTSTAAELNILDGVTATAAELNILDGVTATTAEVNVLDGATAGTAVASKAVVLDSNKDITGIRNFTITGDLKRCW